LITFIVNIYEEKVTEQKNFLNEYFLMLSKIETENIFTINSEYLKLVDIITNNLNNAIENDQPYFSVPNYEKCKTIKIDNDDIKKVIISIYSYCYIFENRFLDSFFLCIIHVFLNYFTNEPTGIIRKNININLISESPEIKSKRDSLNHLLYSLYDAKKKLVKLF